MQLCKAIVCASLVFGLTAPLFSQANETAPSNNPFVTAQSTGNPGSRALGDTIAGPYDVEAATGDIRCLGVDQGWGYYWVTGSASGGGGQQIYQFDLNGVFVAQYSQVSTSPFWGHRDVEIDEANNKLYAGNEGGELVTYDYNPATQSIAFSATTIWGTSGTVRALAEDPNTGNFFTADFFGDVEEVDPSTGLVVNTYFNPSTAAYGAAWDTGSNTLWIQGQDDNGLGNSTHHHEYTVPGGGGLLTFTGREFWGDPLLAGIAGGLGYYDDARNPNGSTLISLSQSTPDSITAYDAESGGCSSPTLSVSGLVAGGMVTADVSCATPTSPVVFAYSLAGGGPTNVPAPICGGSVTVDLGNGNPGTVVQAGVVGSDINGDASLMAPIPPGTTGINVWVQAFDAASCTVTNQFAGTIG